MANPEHLAILKQGMVLVRRRNVILPLLLFMFSVLSSTGAETGPFTLTVKLQDACNPDVEIQTDLNIDKPFRMIKRNGRVDNTISAVLHRPQARRYRLRLHISEYQSKTQNSIEAYDLALELDKPWSGGAIQSTVLRRTVTLSRQKN